MYSKSNTPVLLLIIFICMSHKTKYHEKLFCFVFFSVPLDGKNKAVDVKSVPPLVRLLKDKEPDVRANAAGTLMM